MDIHYMLAFFHEIMTHHEAFFSHAQFTKYLILLDLCLEDSLAQYTPSQHLSDEMGLTSVLKVYALSPDDSIRFMAKLSLSRLIQNLSDQEASCLELTPNEVTNLCQALAAATTSDEHTGDIGSVKFEVVDLLKGMTALAAYSRNRKLLTCEDVNVVDFVPIILTTFVDSERKEALKFLWVLFGDPYIRKQILTSRSFIADQLQELTLCMVDEIKVLSLCTLEAMGSVIEKGMCSPCTCICPV